MDWFAVFGNIVSNIFCFLALDLFIKYIAGYKSDKKKYTIKSLFVFAWIILSIMEPPHISYIAIVIDFIYVIAISKTTFRKQLEIFLKFEIYYFISTTITGLIQTLVSGNAMLFLDNNIYAVYFGITNGFLIYMILYLYIILKKLSEFPTGKIYKRYFLIISSSLTLLLIVSSIFVGSNIFNQKDVAQLFFSLLLVIAFLSLSIYRKVVFVLEENMLSKIEIEKNALEKDYAIQVEENIKKLAVLRHDFKNHMIILHGYAKQDRKEELLEYMENLTTILSTATLVDTPSNLLSSLINAKKADCEHAKVTFDFQWDFQVINIPDFDLITIISNILDNALTAAAKRTDGFIKLNIFDQNGYLVFDCENNHKEIITKEGERFVTTKTNQPQMHGLGLISVRKTVTKLRGELDIEHTDDTFHIKILVPNYK